MKNGFRKISAVFLLVPALAPIFYVLAFHVNQREIRQHISSELDQRPLKTITVSADNISWVRPGTEISIEGRLFDIKQIVYHPDGRISLTGLFDVDESELISELQKDMDAEGDSEYNDQPSPVFQLYWMAHATDQSRVRVSGMKRTYRNTPALSTCIKDILTPPPQA